MNNFDYAIYPFAEDNSKCLRINNDSFESINDSTACLDYLLYNRSINDLTI